MVFLVCNEKTVLRIEAETEAEAFTLATPTLLVSEYDKKYGNMVAVPEPETAETWEELRRKMTVGSGEHLEHFGYLNPYNKRMLDYVVQQIEALVGVALQV